MQQTLQLLAMLSGIDQELDELHSELGDLPREVQEIERLVREKQYAVDETSAELESVVNARSHGRIRAQEIKDKIAKLSEQQYSVRNNKEYDAITKEIETLESEAKILEKDTATANLKEENLQAILESQEAELSDVKAELQDKERELSDLSSGHEEQMNDLLARRQEVVDKVPSDALLNYDRIRDYHPDAIVRVRKNSCSGCFSSVPPQRIVEMRKFMEVFYCENCGRILYPEEMRVPV